MTSAGLAGDPGRSAGGAAAGTAVQTATGRELIPVLVGTSRLTFIFGAVFAIGIML